MKNIKQILTLTFLTKKSKNKKSLLNFTDRRGFGLLTK